MTEDMSRALLNRNTLTPREPKPERRVEIASHYCARINGSDVDVYVVLRAFGVTDQNIGHAVKKLLRSGRGPKGLRQDVHEAIWTLNRWLDIEDAEGGDERVRDEP